MPRNGRKAGFIVPTKGQAAMWNPRRLEPSLARISNIRIHLLGATGPRLFGELTDRTIVRDEHSVPGAKQRGVQVDPAAVYDRDHSPVAPASLSVIFIHEGLGANGTRLGGELLALRVTGLTHFRSVDECQTDPRGADIERVSVDDVGHCVRETGGGALALWRIVSRRISRGATCLAGLRKV